MPYTKEEHEKVASKMQRDSKGHFVHTEEPEPGEQPHRNPVERFIQDHTSYRKSQDDILDVHIGNPLRRITQLLEEIKKQKAFSFTLKGSLGIMGVALALGVFGIFGGGKILCDKGIQSQIGVVKTLNVLETESSGIPVLSQILDYLNPKTPHNRIVLIKNDQTITNLPYSKNVDFSKYADNPVYPEQSRRVVATGDYDACAQTLTVTDTNGLQIYAR